MRYELTDNLFLSPVDKNRETIATYGPTLNVEQDGRLLKLDLDYAYARYEYLDEPELNDIDEKHYGTLDGVLFPRHNFNVEMNADARLESLDRRRSDVTDIPSENSVNRYHRQVRPVYKFRIGNRHAGEIAYVYDAVDYEQDRGDETMSHKGEFIIEMERSTRTKFRLTGFFEQFETAWYRDYDHIRGTLGLEWSSGKIVEMSLSGGMSWFDYFDGTESESPVIDGQLHFAIGRVHAVDFGYVEAVEHDVVDGQFETRRAEGSIYRSSRFGWRVGYAYREDHFIEVDRDDIDRGVMAELSCQITPKLMIRIRGESRNLEFEPLAEKVDRENASAVVEYMPNEMIGFGCEYAYRNNDSSDDNNDYVENRAFCEARFLFALIRR